MTHEQCYKDVSSLSGIEITEQNVLRSDQTFHSNMDANSSQALIKQDNYKAKKIGSQDHGGRERQQEQILLFDKDSAIDSIAMPSVSNSHKMDESTKERDQSNTSTHRKHNTHHQHRKHHASKSTRCQVKGIKDHTQVIAEAAACKAINPHFVKSHSDSILPSPSTKALKLHRDEMTNTFNTTRDSLEEFSSKSIHRQMNVTSETNKQPQDGLRFPNQMGNVQKAELPKEHHLSREKPACTEFTRQTVSLKHKKKDIQRSQNNIVERKQGALPIYHNTHTCLFGEAQLPAQGSHQSRKQTFAKPQGNFSNDRSRCKHGLGKSQADDCILFETTSELGPEREISWFSTRNLDNVATLKSIDDENEKDVFHLKAALAYAPPGEPMSRPIQPMDATIPPHLQSEVVMTQTGGERPGAYFVAAPGSSVETICLSSSNASWSGCHGCDEASQQDVMSNNHAQGHLCGAFNIDGGQVGTDENYRVEAQIVEDDRSAVLAEVVVWYKRQLYRWILVAAVMLVLVIVVLGVSLGIEASVPKMAPVLVPTLAPTLVPTSPPAELIACSFLSLSMNVCHKTTEAYGGVPWSTIPTELGILTNLSYLSLSLSQLTGTIPSEIGALTILTSLSLSKNQLNGTIPSEIGAMISLEVLSLYQNQLIGTIPSEFGGLTSLDKLFLDTNELNGTIPSELSNLNASRIDLFSNSLSGTISTELCQSVDEIVTNCADIECSCCSSYDETTEETALCD